MRDPIAKLRALVTTASPAVKELLEPFPQRLQEALALATRWAREHCGEESAKRGQRRPAARHGVA